VGLDVHKETTAVAVLRVGAVEPDHRVIPTTPEAYRKLVRGLKSQDAVFCYEAGPCGFDPYRMLHAAGADCDVIAPTLIPRRYGHKVKTDRIDARNLARLHRAGELTGSLLFAPEAIRLASAAHTGFSFGDNSVSATRRTRIDAGAGAFIVGTGGAEVRQNPDGSISFHT
jgi:hypothetical protein